MSVVVEDRDGERPIARDEIVDIDHPGNVHAVLGGLLSVYGLLNIAGGAPQCDEKGPSFCTGVFMPATVGVALLAWGLVVWTRSTSAASQTGSSAPERD